MKYWCLDKIKWKKAKKGRKTEPQRFLNTMTIHAHDSDVNDLAVSPNDKLVATASHDKTAKVRNPSLY